MLRRVSVAAVGIPAAVGVVYLGGWVLAGALAVFGALGALEFYRLGQRSGLMPLRGAGAMGAALMPLAALAALPAGWSLDAGWIGIGAALWFAGSVSLGALSRGPDNRPLASLAVTLFGALYAGALPAFLLPLRHGLPTDSAAAATALVFLPLVVTWIGDTLAMGGGTLVGGRKLAPVLSPHKTWAGAVTGAVGALLVAPLYGSVVLVRFGVAIPWWQLAVFGLVISIVGQVGDVSESLFKREAGVKDSGGFFPGHGGVLDRFDSLYWVLPVSVLLLRLFGTV